jgi:hypothetical protein
MGACGVPEPDADRGAPEPDRFAPADEDEPLPAAGEMRVVLCEPCVHELSTRHRSSKAQADTNG